MSEPFGQAILTFMEVMSPTKLLAPLLSQFQVRQAPQPTEYAAIVRADQAPDLFQVTSGLPVERRMTASWQNSQLVGKSYSNAPFMGPKTRSDEQVFQGMGNIEGTPEQDSEVISQVQTRDEVRNVLGPVGSARAAQKTGKRTSFY